MVKETLRKEKDNNDEVIIYIDSKRGVININYNDSDEDIELDKEMINHLRELINKNFD